MVHISDKTEKCVKISKFTTHFHRQFLRFEKCSVCMVLLMNGIGIIVTTKILWFSSKLKMLVALFITRKLKTFSALLILLCLLF